MDTMIWNLLASTGTALIEVEEKQLTNYKNKWSHLEESLCKCQKLKYHENLETINEWSAVETKASSGTERLAQITRLIRGTRDFQAKRCPVENSMSTCENRRVELVDALANRAESSWTRPTFCSELSSGVFRGGVWEFAPPPFIFVN